MSFDVRFSDREGSAILTPATVIFSVVNYSRAAQGGDKQALIRATGQPEGVWSLLGWLLYGVAIHNQYGTLCWRGVVNRVDVAAGAIRMGVSLDDMYNSVAVTYADGATRGLTDFNWDANSSAIYGYKELILSAENLTAAAAAQLRDRQLAQTKLPVPVTEIEPGGDTTITAEIECIGKFWLFDWTYYSRDEGLVEYVPSGGQAQKVGLGFTSTGVAFEAYNRVMTDINGNLGELKKNDVIEIASSVDNDGTYTVESGTNLEAGVITSTAIGLYGEFVSVEKERITARHDVWRNLNNVNLDESSSFIVVNEDEDETYTTPDDYTVDYDLGLFKAASGATAPNITNGQEVLVSYGFFEFRLEDTSGVGIFDGINAHDVVKLDGTTANDGYYRVLRSADEGTVLYVYPGFNGNEDPDGETAFDVAYGQQIKLAASEFPLEDEFPTGNVTVTLHGQAVAQRFTITSDAAWTCAAIEIQCRKIGSPADNLKVALYSHNALNYPDTQLDSAQIAGSAVPTTMSKIRFDLTNTIPLATSTNYWVVVWRTGDLDSDDYYEVLLNEDLGYTNGVLKVSDGSAYVDRTPDADLWFRVLGLESTTTQITELESVEGQFTAGCNIESVSGINTWQYRDGMATTLTELLDLLNIGTTNGRRLLADITTEDYLHVWEEPAKPDVGDTPAYYLDSRGQILDPLQQPLETGVLVAGVWVHLSDIIPAAAPVGFAASPSPLFIEEAEMDVEAGTVRLSPRDVSSPWAFGPQAG